jgi:thiol-disulfide isomerase/thioredoxin
MKSTHKVKNLLSIVALLLLLSLFRCGVDSHQGNPNNDFDFNLPDLEGGMHSMEDLSGQITVLNFWATWCPPCLEEVPKLNDLYKRYKDKGVQVVGIALDKDSLDLVQPFVKENNISYRILLGNQEVLAGLRNFQGVPTTIILDQEGKIHKRFDGSFDEKKLEEALQLLLEDLQ